MASSHSFCWAIRSYFFAVKSCYKLKICPKCYAGKWFLPHILCCISPLSLGIWHPVKRRSKQINGNVFALGSFAPPRLWNNRLGRGIQWQLIWYPLRRAMQKLIQYPSIKSLRLASSFSAEMSSFASSEQWQSSRGIITNKTLAIDTVPRRDEEQLGRGRGKREENQRRLEWRKVGTLRPNWCQWIFFWCSATRIRWICRKYIRKSGETIADNEVAFEIPSVPPFPKWLNN